MHDAGGKILVPDVLKDVIKYLRDEGYADGLEDGFARVNKLNQYLLKEKRFADLKRATEDDVFQEKLMEEYGI